MSPTEDGQPESDADWAPLAEALVAVLPPSVPPLPASGGLQGLLGVVKHGIDPRRIIRRIPLDEKDPDPPEGTLVADRRPSGRAPKGDTRSGKIRYVEIPIDLIACAMKAFPDSMDWDGAYFWVLARTELPRLEELRWVMARLKAKMGLLSPTHEQYRPHLSEAACVQREQLSQDALVTRYAASLAPLVQSASPDSISLLAALVAESFLTEQDVLLDLHRDAFGEAVSQLFSNPRLADIREPFDALVTGPILNCAWEFPAIYHVSSLRAPFLTLDAWNKLTGIEGWLVLA